MEKTQYSNYLLLVDSVIFLVRKIIYNQRKKVQQI